MLAVERRIKVLERIAADQAVEVSSLAREFGVSEMTIRRDLRRLDRDGFVRRTYGGATTNGPIADTWMYSMSRNTWTRVRSSGTQPAARLYPSMVYDAIAKRTKRHIVSPWGN